VENQSAMRVMLVSDSLRRNINPAAFGSPISVWFGVLGHIYSMTSFIKYEISVVFVAGSLSERGAHGGSSADSLNGGGGGDPSVIKKKKDQLNHSKQKALRVLSGGDHPGGKALVTKTRSAPGRTQQDEEVSPSVVAAVVVHQHDNETDTDNDEIMERDVAIAKVRIHFARRR